MSIPSRGGTPDGHEEQRTVDLAEDERRYLLLLDGVRVGSTSYADHGSQRVFIHTEIDLNQSGKGLASALVTAALADVRARGLRVVAICPFTSSYLRGHREWDDIVDPVTPRLKADLRAAGLL